MSSQKPFRPDTRQTSWLIKAGYIAARKARKDSKAHGLAITFIKNDVIYLEHANGKTERIGTISSEKIIRPLLVKGTILRAR